MKQLLISIILVFLMTGNSKSQETVKLYYNSNWELTDSTNMEYYRIAQINSESLLFHGWVKDYYNENYYEKS